MQLFVGTKGLVTYRDTILLLRESSEYVDGTEYGRWDFPGGRIESSETLQEGLIREVAEESGLTVSTGKLLGAYDGFPVIKGEPCHIVRLYFACEAHTDEVVLSGDHDAYAWVTKEESKDYDLMDDLRETIENI